MTIKKFANAHNITYIINAASMFVQLKFSSLALHVSGASIRKALSPTVWLSLAERFNYANCGSLN